MEGSPRLLWSGFSCLSVVLKRLSVCILELAIMKAGGGDMINAKPQKSEADKEGKVRSQQSLFWAMFL